MTSLTILFEDNHLIVVEKPYGVPTQADRSGDPDLFNMVKAYLKEKYQKRGAVYLGLVHRLDRPVGGVVVFAKTSKAASRLSAQVRDGRFRKAYLAVVQGKPTPAGGMLDHWLVKDHVRNRVAVTTPGAPGAKRALLTYRTIAVADGLALLTVSLETGRSHQIRVQLAAIGHPILGDEKYGPKHGDALSALALHAAEVACAHPVGGAPLRFRSLPPVTEPWRSFAREVRSLVPLIS